MGEAQVSPLVQRTGWPSCHCQLRVSMSVCSWGFCLVFKDRHTLRQGYAVIQQAITNSWTAFSGRTKRFEFLSYCSKTPEFSTRRSREILCFLLVVSTVYICTFVLLENLTYDAVAKLYGKKFSTFSLYFDETFRHIELSNIIINQIQWNSPKYFLQVGGGGDCEHFIDVD